MKSLLMNVTLLFINISSYHDSYNWSSRPLIRFGAFYVYPPTQKYRYFKIIPPPLLLRKCFLFGLYAVIEWNIWFVSERIRCISCISPFCYPIIPSPIIRKNERITWIAIQPTNALNFCNMRTYQRFVYVYI